MKTKSVRVAKLKEFLNITKSAMYPTWLFEGEEEPKEEEQFVGPEYDPDLLLHEPIAAVLMGEAEGEGVNGMRAVYHVISNRAKKKGVSPLSIVSDPYQFSILNGTTIQALINKYKNHSNPAVKELWNKAKGIVMAPGADITGGATHYYTGAIPSWASAENPCWVAGPKIGKHQFGQNRADKLWGTTSTGRCYIDREDTHPG